MERLYFPDENQVPNEDDFENMNDDDDIIINDEVLTTAIINGNQIRDDVFDDPILLNVLPKKVEEDIIITHVLNLKSNGAITRSTSYYNHQDDDDDDDDEIDILYYNNNDVLQLDNDDIDIIEFIEDQLY